MLSRHLLRLNNETGKSGELEFDYPESAGGQLTDPNRHAQEGEEKRGHNHPASEKCGRYCPRKPELQGTQEEGRPLPQEQMIWVPSNGRCACSAAGTAVARREIAVDLTSMVGLALEAVACYDRG